MKKQSAELDVRRISLFCAVVCCCLLLMLHALSFSRHLSAVPKVDAVFVAIDIYIAAVWKRKK